MNNVTVFLPSVSFIVSRHRRQTRAHSRRVREYVRPCRAVQPCRFP